MSQLSVLDGKFDWSITLEEWRHEYSIGERGGREGNEERKSYRANHVNSVLSFGGSLLLMA